MKKLLITLVFLLTAHAHAELEPLVPNYVEEPIYKPVKPIRNDRFIERQHPTYPREEQQLNRSGSVTLEFIIDETGKATHINTVHATSPAFEKAARQSIEKSTFKVTTIDGVPTKQKARQTIEFRLD